MIKYIEKDLFEEINTNVGYVQCVSADFACGAGIALEFNKHFNVKNKLKQLNIKPNVGDVVVVDNVYNLVTKEHYYDKPTLASMQDCLDMLNQVNKHDTLRMPRIGCGLDKLKWEDVEMMLIVLMDHEDLDIEVYSKNKIEKENIAMIITEGRQLEKLPYGESVVKLGCTTGDQCWSVHSALFTINHEKKYNEEKKKWEYKPVPFAKRRFIYIDSPIRGRVLLDSKAIAEHIKYNMKNTLTLKVPVDKLIETTPEGKKITKWVLTKKKMCSMAKMIKEVTTYLSDVGYTKHLKYNGPYLSECSASESEKDINVIRHKRYHNGIKINLKLYPDNERSRSIVDKYLKAYKVLEAVHLKYYTLKTPENYEDNILAEIFDNYNSPDENENIVTRRWLDNEVRFKEETIEQLENDDKYITIVHRNVYIKDVDMLLDYLPLRNNFYKLCENLNLLCVPRQQILEIVNKLTAQDRMSDMPDGKFESFLFDFDRMDEDDDEEEEDE